MIKETDIETQQKIPVLGSLWGIGKLFRRNQVTRERSEIVIALVPRIVRCECPVDCDCQLERATTPLLYGPLQEMPRPWEAQLPDAINNSRRIDLRRIGPDGFSPDKPRPATWYFPTDEEAAASYGTIYTPAYTSEYMPGSFYTPAYTPEGAPGSFDQSGLKDATYAPLPVPQTR